MHQLIRSTGILDPVVEIRLSKRQVDDLLKEVQAWILNEQRALIVTPTQRMAEDLSEYLIEIGIKTHHLHAKIDTIERIEIRRALRFGVYDTVVRVNIFRKGLDLPEVPLVVILDADKELPTLLS